MNNDAYAAYNYDDKERLNSSSGGVFSLFAKEVLGKSGTVYGVAMDRDCSNAAVIRITDENNLYRLRGSKYLQAKVANAFINVRKDLEEGKIVLYSGTPCQINGLKLYLNHEYDNLICVDIICHGVPSPLLWRKYIKREEEKLGSRVKSVNFRDKTNGWLNYCLSKEIGEEVIYSDLDNDPYMQLFLKNYSLRPSCYNCLVKKRNMSDITIGDFWGINDVLPEMNDNKGISIIVTRTRKGINLVESLKDKMTIQRVDYIQAIKGNSSLSESAVEPNLRDAFFHDVNNLDIDRLRKKYIHTSLLIRIKKLVKSATGHI